MNAQVYHAIGACLGGYEDLIQAAMAMTRIPISSKSNKHEKAYWRPLHKNQTESLMETSIFTFQQAILLLVK